MFDAHTCVLRAEIITFCKTALTESHPRDDYEEFLKLTLIFLGGVDRDKASFKSPGAFHHARWMAKAIYCIKICLFRQQFSLTPMEKRNITELALFASLVYARFWHEAPLPIKAPLNDLLLIEELGHYPNATVANAALTAFSRHLWYFSEILVGLSLFDDRIEVDVKTKMVENLQVAKASKSVKRLAHPPEPLNTAGLASCFSQRTSVLFDVIHINGSSLAQSFLSKNPSEWSGDISYQELRTAASAMTVVNDSAERAIALMQKYNASLTNNEEQKQFILQLVRHHRKTYPNCSKATLMKNSY
jgi:hypothetical protein